VGFDGMIVRSREIQSAGANQPVAGGNVGAKNPSAVTVWETPAILMSHACDILRIQAPAYAVKN